MKINDMIWYDSV